MGLVNRSVDVLGASVAEAVEAWCDVALWGSFVEGFAAVVAREGRWPQVGAVVVWDSTANGRGRVTERVLALRRGSAADPAATAPGATAAAQRPPATGAGEVTADDAPMLQEVEISEDRLQGLRRTWIAPIADGVRVAVELDYRLRGGRASSLALDRLFVARPIAAAIARELDAFGGQLARIVSRAGD